MNERRQVGTGEIVEGGRGRDQRRRPSVRLLQDGQVNRLTIEAETPCEGGRAKAGQHNGPTLAELTRLARCAGCCSGAAHAAALAATTSISSRNPGRTSAGTIINIEAGRAVPRKRLRTAA